MAARQIMNMTFAIGLQKLNIAQLALGGLGIKKISTSLNDKNKSFHRHYNGESKLQYSKLKVEDNNNAAERLKLNR